MEVGWMDLPAAQRLRNDTLVQCRKSAIWRNILSPAFGLHFEHPLKRNFMLPIEYVHPSSKSTRPHEISQPQECLRSLAMF
jgi:hypothetical protein